MIFIWTSFNWIETILPNQDNQTFFGLGDMYQGRHKGLSEQYVI